MAVSTAAIVLIVLGLIFLFVIIGCSIFFCCWWWRRRRKNSVKKTEYFKRTSLDVSVRHHPNTQVQETAFHSRPEQNGHVRSHHPKHHATSGVTRQTDGYINKAFTGDNEEFTVIKTIPVANGGTYPHRVHKRKTQAVSVPLYTNKPNTQRHHHRQHRHHHQAGGAGGEGFDYVDSTKHVVRQHRVLSSNNNQGPVYVYDNNQYAAVRGYVRPHHRQQQHIKKHHHQRHQYQHSGWPEAADLWPGRTTAGTTHGHKHKGYDHNWSMGRADYMNSLRRYHEVPIDLPLETNNNVVTVEQAPSRLSVDDTDGTALHLKWSPSVARRKHKKRQQEVEQERPPSVGSFKIATNTLPMTRNKHQLPSPIPRENRNPMTKF